MADADTLTMTLETGPVTIRLRPDLAPKHVARITELANEGFYDGVVFHRVIDGFMAQGGDPTGTGTAARRSPTCRPSSPPSRTSAAPAPWPAPTIPNSANSQFFICLADSRFLDRQYTVWGEVTSGMEHIDALPKGEPPRAPGKIISMRVG